MTDYENVSLSPSIDVTVVNTTESSMHLELSDGEGIASKTVKKVAKVVLYPFHEAPHYQQDNHFILTGYRGELRTFQRCLGSLWYIHNETGMFLLVLADKSEHLVTFAWSSRIRDSCRNRIVYVLTTLSHLITCRYCCVFLLLRRCSNVSWNECERM